MYASESATPSPQEEEKQSSLSLSEGPQPSNDNDITKGDEKVETTTKEPPKDESESKKPTLSTLAAQHKSFYTSFWDDKGSLAILNVLVLVIGLLSPVFAVPPSTVRSALRWHPMPDSHLK